MEVVTKNANNFVMNITLLSNVYKLATAQKRKI